MVITPKNGNIPLTVTCCDLSEQSSEITSWRWAFGDEETYQTIKQENRNTASYLEWSD